MKSKTVACIIFFLSILSFIPIQNEVWAEENMSPKFTVRANLPDNQLNDVTGYFHISMESGQKQQLTVEITNTTDEVLTVVSSLATATTNSNGVINYKETDEIIDKSLAIDFKKISLLSETDVVLQAFETKELTIFIELPETEVEGQLLGGVSFEEDLSEEKEESSSMVVNRFSYNIAVMIELGNETPENDLQLNEVNAAQRSGFNFIEANLQNIAARLISSLAVEATVHRLNEETPLYTSNQTGLKMAPNSNFNYGIDLQRTPIQPGEYRIHVLIVADDKTYEFEKEFTITTEEARHLNESAVLAETPNDYQLIVVMVAVAIFMILGILIFFMVKQTKSKKQK